MRDIAIFNTHSNVVNIVDGRFAYSKDGQEVALDENLIAAEITRLQAEYAAKQYQRDRAAAYPSLAEQMDMQYWDSINGTTVWADTIAAIKERFPKP